MSTVVATVLCRKRLGHRPEWHSGTDHDGGGEVPQIVQTDPWDAGLRGQLAEVVECVLRPEWESVGSREHQAHVLVVACRQTLTVLARPLSA